MDAVSGSIILDSTGKLRKCFDISFHTFRNKAISVQDLKLQWSQKMKDGFAEKLTEKEAVAINNDEKRLNMLEKLKQLGGPFTKAEEVDEFLLNAKSKASSKRYNKLSKKLWNDLGKE